MFWDKAAGVIARTILLDGMTKRYISDHPESTVINIACGMDTLDYKVNSCQLKYFRLNGIKMAEWNIRAANRMIY